MGPARLVELWAGLIVVLMIVLTVIFRVEQRAVWPFGELTPEPQLPDPTGYARRFATEAQQLGWQMLGWAPDWKLAKYNVNYACMVSPDQTTFAVIGTGRLLNTPIEATWLWTPLSDGRTVYTTDNQNGVSIDISGNWRNQLVFEKSFRRLYQRHQEWLRSLGAGTRNFARGREFDELRQVREQHFREMERAGLIAYTDGSGRLFQFTLLGAAKTATWSYIAGMSRRLSRGAVPRVV